MSTASPRDIIAKEVAASVFGSARAMPSDHVHADNLLSALTAAGYRVLREGDLDAATEALKDATAHLVGAASAYREHAARSSSVGRAKVDPFFTTRASDFDKAAERARSALRALVGEAK